MEDMMERLKVVEELKKELNKKLNEKLDELEMTASKVQRDMLFMCCHHECDL